MLAAICNYIKTENINFESVKEFKYLESVINSENSIIQEIRERIAAGN